MRPLRHPTVQAVLSWSLAQWLRLCIATIRWHREGLDEAEAVWSQTGRQGVVVMFWHSRIALAPAAWPMHRVRQGTCQPARALISLSQDGEFVARAVDRLGFPAIRGSSTKKSATDKAKGGANAFRDGLRWLRSHGCLAITPDGPRGPAEVMAEGASTFCAMTPAPALLLGLACRPALRLGGWDDGLLPLPFARGAILWRRLDYPEGEAAPVVAEAWGQALSELTRQAEARVA